MPTLALNGVELELPRNLALLDTNVLVAFADNRDNDHDDATFIVNEFSDYIWSVTPPVVVEACGLLGSRRDQSTVDALLRWLITPGNVILLPAPHDPGETSTILAENVTWMRSRAIDYVDSALMKYADLITTACDLRPHLPIFTFDTRDFLRCAGSSYLYSLYDMRALELIPFGE